MAGDLNIDEWIGKVYSEHKTVETLPKRFSSTSRKFRKFCVNNTHASYPMYIGEYHSSPATFIASANILYPYGMRTLENVDIYTLGYHIYGANYATFQWIATL